MFSGFEMHAKVWTEWLKYDIALCVSAPLSQNMGMLNDSAGQRTILKKEGNLRISAIEFIMGQ